MTEKTERGRSQRGKHVRDVRDWFGWGRVTAEVRRDKNQNTARQWMGRVSDFLPMLMEVTAILFLILLMVEEETRRRESRRRRSEEEKEEEEEGGGKRKEEKKRRPTTIPSATQTNKKKK